LNNKQTAKQQNMNNNNNNNSKDSFLNLVVATRLHLGQASVAPKRDDLRATILQFYAFCQRAQASMGVIAVDATPPVFDVTTSTTTAAAADTDTASGVFDLVQAVQDICLTIAADQNNDADAAAATASTPTVMTTLHVLPVTPWGQFVPALNALISFAAAARSTSCHNNNIAAAAADRILFVSAETTLASQTAIQSLLRHLDLETTLVVGARLPGHDYQHHHQQTPNVVVTGSSTNEDATAVGSRSCSSSSYTVVPLNGRTTPWNTLAVWNLRQLARTGFVQVSEGLLTDRQTEPSQGVEEVMAIALQQHLFGRQQCLAKLVQLDDQPNDNNKNSDNKLWEESFRDPQRQAWHDAKMKSKLERAARQAALFPNEIMTNAQVHHY
jgi:hypothetical protein